MHPEEVDRLKEELTRTKQTLAALVKERAEPEKTHEAFAKQMDLVQNEHDMIVYSFSHDLRRPLRRIKGFLDIVLTDSDNKLSESSLQYLRWVKQDTERAHAALDCFVSIARIKREGIRRQSFNVSQLLHRVLESTSQSIAERQTEIQIEEVLHANGDEKQIGIVFSNLLTNALIFNKQPVRKITWFSFQKDSSIVYGIRDNGVGIHTEDYHRLFYPLSQLHYDLHPQGLGFGLATCKAIVMAHGGNIWCESKADIGSTFYFSLPVEEIV